MRSCSATGISCSRPCAWRSGDLPEAIEIYGRPLEPMLLSKHYLYFPLMVLGVSLVLVRFASLNDRVFIAAIAYALAVLCFFLWWQLVAHGLAIELFYYFCSSRAGVLYSSALVVARIGAFVTPNGRPLVFTVVTVAALAMPLMIANHGVALQSVSLGLLLSLAALVCTLAWLAPFNSIVATAAALCFALTGPLYWYESDGLENGSNVPRFDPRFPHLVGKNSTEAMDLGRVALQLVSVIPKFQDDDRELLFWYRNSDQVLNSLQATYLWMYSRLNHDASSTGMPILRGQDVERMYRHRSVNLVLLARHDDEVGAALSVLRERGIAYEQRGEFRLCSRAVCVQVVDVGRRFHVVGSLWIRRVRARWDAFLGRRYGPRVSILRELVRHQRHSAGPCPSIRASDGPGSETSPDRPQWVRL